MHRALGRFEESDGEYHNALAVRASLIGANLPALYPEQGQKKFLDRFASERDLYVTNAIQANAGEQSRRNGAETNRMYKGLRLGMQQELVSRVRREGGATAGVTALLRSLRILSAIRSPGALEARRSQEAATSPLSGKERDAIELKLMSLASYSEWKKEVEETTVRRALPPDGALIDVAYFREQDFHEIPIRRTGAWRYAAFVYTPQATYTVDLGPAEAINGLVDQILGMESRLFRNGSLQSADRILADQVECRRLIVQLSQRLWKPIHASVAPQNEAVRHWIVSPDGELGSLPWEMLLDGQGRYLIQSSLITYIDSPRTLTQPNRSSPANAAVAILNPLYDLTKKPDAPENLGPEQEYEDLTLSGEGALTPLYQGELARQFAAANPGARVLELDQATEAAVFNALRPSNLLIWTHGQVLDNAADPFERGRVLLAGVAQKRSPTKDRDGYLTARKAMGLDLTGTRLAVIGGCNTGYGSVEAGEGLQGMRRALWVAGAQSQMLNLWSVADRPTVRWLELFYTELSKTGTSRAQAIATVDREFIAGRVKGLGPEQTHPYFWAAFTLSGDWRE